MEKEKYKEEAINENKNSQTEDIKEEIKNEEAEAVENPADIEENRVTQNEELELKEEDAAEEQMEEEGEISEAEQLRIDLAESKDKYLRLYSEFENFRRRTAKERMALVKNAHEDLLVSLLPVKDDFERALMVAEEKDMTGSDTSKEGLQLIYNKFSKVLEQKGLKQMETEVGGEFDSELHDAITQIPAPEDKLKGKIVDVIEKGYYLNDKVVRHAKVVIGS